MPSPAQSSLCIGALSISISNTAVAGSVSLKTLTQPCMKRRKSRDNGLAARIAAVVHENDA